MNDDATRIAQPSQNNYQQPRPSQPNYGRQSQQPYYAPAPQKKSNAGLWIVVGILAAALLGLGGWLLVDTLNDKGVQQPSKDAQVTSAMDKAEQKRAEEQTTSQPQEPQPQPQTVAPAPQQTVATTTRRPSGTVVLKGKLNGDNVTFTLYPQGGDYYVGSFQNHKVGVTWSVEGYLTSNRFDFTSTGLPKNWSFVAAADGESFAGTSSNGSVTYNMYLHYQ